MFGKVMIATLVSVSLMVSGCSVAEIRGKAPTTVDECEANWLQETGAIAHDAFEITTIKPIVAVGPPKRPAHCPPGAGVLYGGSGYCVGR